jgi:hypothetical protein
MEATHCLLKFYHRKELPTWLWLPNVPYYRRCGLAGSVGKSRGIHGFGRNGVRIDDMIGRDTDSAY